MIFGVIKPLEALETEIAFCQKALNVDYTVKMSLTICILVVIEKDTSLLRRMAIIWVDNGVM